MQTIFSLPFTIILLLLLALGSFFFSASETSIIGLSKIKLRHMLAKGLKRARYIQHLVVNLDKFLIALLVGNNFVNIAISAIITGVCVSIFGIKLGVFIATFSAALLVLIFCEIIPKMLAIKHTERTALFVAPLMELFIKLFSPVIAIFSWVSDIVIKVLRIGPAKRSPLVTEEELRLMIELGREEGFLSDEEGRMLQRIFEFGDTKVSDVMVNKDKIISLNINASPEELLNIFVEEGHARLPVYEGPLNNIIGVIYARDLLYVLRDKGLFLLSDLVNAVYYASANLRVNELLKIFQKNKIQIAIVVDEHKRALGLVTLEDLIEEIVGEIEEHHSERGINKN
ncbi:HlyC/CorC family transporter [bacterium]|nr:MAG: HlyC/CorC family transporter [bacterium]